MLLRSCLSEIGSCSIVRFIRRKVPDFCAFAVQEKVTLRCKMASTAVIGAGGPTGKECVKRLLELGQPAVAIVRNPEKYKDAFGSNKNLTLLPGDVTDVASLKSAFKEGHIKNVIFAASGKTYWSAKSVDEQVYIRTLNHTQCTTPYGAEMTIKGVFS